MKILKLFLMVCLIACRQNPLPQQQKKDEPTSVTDTIAVTNDPKSDANIQANSFNEIDTSGILMSPLIHTETSNDGGSFSSGGRERDYWNIIFYNSKTGICHLLSDSLKMLIKSYSIGTDNSSGSNSSSEIIYSSTDVEREYIFYSMKINDYNNDKALSDLDPSYLFVSDKEGNKLQQISPANCNLLSYQYINASDKIIMNVQIDTNKDKLFDENDATSWYEINPRKDVAPKEIFKQDFKNKVKLLFYKQWQQLH